jgi:hypothetical protein
MGCLARPARSTATQCNAVAYHIRYGYHSYIFGDKSADIRTKGLIFGDTDTDRVLIFEDKGTDIRTKGLIFGDTNTDRVLIFEDKGTDIRTKGLVIICAPSYGQA